VLELCAFVRAGPLVRLCSVRPDRAGFARQRRRHREGAPRSSRSCGLCSSPSPTSHFSSTPPMHPNDPGRCACLRFVRLRLPFPRCVYLLCVRLLCMLSFCAIAQYCTSLSCRVYACLCSSLTSPSCPGRESVPMLCVLELCAFVRAGPVVRLCSVRPDRAGFARQRRRYCEGAPRSSRSCGLCSSPSPTSPFSSTPPMHPNDPGRCACLRFVLPCPRCVYLLCVRLLCMLSFCAIAHYCTSLSFRAHACLCSSLTSPFCPGKET